MNAGCFDREMSDVVAGVKAADENGEKEFGHARCGFAYRKSAFQSNGMIVTRVLLALKPEKPEKIKAAMKEILEKRSLPNHWNIRARAAYSAPRAARPQDF